MKKSAVGAARLYSIIALMRTTWPDKSLGELLMGACANNATVMMNSSDDELVERLTDYHQGMMEDKLYLTKHKRG